MRKELQRECLKRTRYVLEEWWRKNPKPFIDAMDDRILWIASGREEYWYGKEECLKHCTRLEDLPGVYLQGQEYSIVHSDKTTCVVAGRYIAYTEEGEAMVLSETQRITFVWKLEGERLTIIHLHLSNALHILEEGEEFPRKAGLDTAAYLQRLLNDWTGREMLSVMSARRQEHIIPAMDILYVKADGEFCQIYTTQKLISCLESFKSVAERLGTEFYQIHRSILVNLTYIRLVEPGSCTLFEGTRLPVAKRRMKAFRERIRQG